MVSVGIVYLVLGVLMRLYWLTQQRSPYKRTVLRISSLFLIIGCLEIVMAVVAFFVPILKEYRIVIGGGIVCTVFPIILFELSKVTRAIER